MRVSAPPSEMRRLATSLVDAVDPHRVLDRLEKIHQVWRPTGAFLDAQPKSPFRGRSAVDISIPRDRIVLWDVPRRGERVLLARELLCHIDRAGRTRVLTNMAKRVREVGRRCEELGTSWTLDITGSAAPLVVASRLAETFSPLGAKRSHFRPLELAWFFGRMKRFYLLQVHLLEHPDARLRELDSDHRIWGEIHDRLRIRDRAAHLALRVRYPRGVSFHSRKMDLIFDRRTRLLRLFGYRVKALNRGLRSWHRVSRWRADPELGLMTPCKRRVLVRNADIPRDPLAEPEWTIAARAEPYTALRWREGAR